MHRAEILRSFAQNQLSSTPLPPLAAAIRTLREHLGDRLGPGCLLQAGDVRLPLGVGVTAIPCSELKAPGCLTPPAGNDFLAAIVGA